VSDVYGDVFAFPSPPGKGIVTNTGQGSPHPTGFHLSRREQAGQYRHAKTTLALAWPLLIAAPLEHGLRSADATRSRYKLSVRLIIVRQAGFRCRSNHASTTIPFQQQAEIRDWDQACPWPKIKGKLAARPLLLA
jgi:hypothetical protein